MHKRIFALGAVAAAACLSAGVAQASTTYSGTVANGSCDNSRSVAVSGPSRIDAEVSSTSATNNNVYVDVVGPDGSVRASGTTASYDTAGGGAYSLRVCSHGSQIDPPSLQYKVLYATGPAGQPALPRMAAELTLHSTAGRDFMGTGAIRTGHGLAYFTVRKNDNGTATIRVYNPRANTHTTFAGAGVHYLTNGVRFTQNRMTMIIVMGKTTRVVYRSPHFKATGRVVKGSFLIL